MRTALTIAGSDSGGGAGIQADLKTFAAHGVFGTSAITALTAQNTHGVTAVHIITPAMVRAQIDAVVTDIGAHAVKLGMLANAEIVREVAAAIDAHRLSPVVLDPVMIAKGGSRLLAADAVDAIVTELLPRCAIVTPNSEEAAALTGRAVESVADLEGAVRALVGMGARAALVKGGHLPGDEVTDLFWDGQEARVFRSPRQRTAHTHGTGCTLASAIAARMARGEALADAVEGAIAYVQSAIAAAPGLGSGHGPLNHFPGSSLY